MNPAASFLPRLESISKSSLRKPYEYQHGTTRCSVTLAAFLIGVLGTGVLVTPDPANAADVSGSTTPLQEMSTPYSLGGTASSAGVRPVLLPFPPNPAFPINCSGPTPIVSPLCHFADPIQCLPIQDIPCLAVAGTGSAATGPVHTFLFAVVSVATLLSQAGRFGGARLDETPSIGVKIGRWSVRKRGSAVVPLHLVCPKLRESELVSQ